HSHEDTPHPRHPTTRRCVDSWPRGISPESGVQKRPRQKRSPCVDEHSGERNRRAADPNTRHNLTREHDDEERRSSGPRIRETNSPLGQTCEIYFTSVCPLRQEIP